MKTCVQVSVVFVLALIGLGSALQCFQCTDYTGTCDTVRTCSGQSDGCLTLSERNGKIYRQCIRFSDCDTSTLFGMFPTIAKFSHKCCTRDLCNGASVSSATTSVITLLLSLALFWCCII